MRKYFLFGLLAGLLGCLVAGIAGGQVRLPPPGLASGPQCFRPPTDIDPRRSLFVTERAVVEQARASDTDGLQAIVKRSTHRAGHGA